jgi:AraC family transcriptional regulator, arabinose operon regulatory protein
MHILSIQVRNTRMHEDIISFIQDEGRDDPFFLEMAGTSYCDGSYHIERSCSAIYVLEYVKQGKGTVTEDGRSFTAAKGDVYLLHRGCAHFYQSDSANPWVKVWMNVRGPLADSLVHAYCLGSLNHVQGLDLSDLFDELLACAKAARGSADEILPEAAVLFHRMAARICSFVRSDDARLLQDPQILKSWLDSHIYAEVSMNELAGQIYRSPSHTIRIFKKAFGVTPYDYHLNKRIETAKLLLNNTNMQIKEIAYKLHFADEHYFSNLFKQKAGSSPAQYRQRAKKNQ